MLLPVRDHELELEGAELADELAGERKGGLPLVALVPGQSQRAGGVPVAQLLQIAAEVECPSVLEFLNQLEGDAVLRVRTVLPRLLALHI